MGAGNGVLGDVVKGALAGAAATWLMGKVTSALYAWESDEARSREDDARGGKTSYGVAAEKAAALAERPLTDEERERAGAALHWLTGVGAGVTYALLARRYPALERTRGLVFGTGFFLAVDELANAALGLTPGPTAFPWETHGRGLAGHLAFGLAADTSLRVLDRVA
jgi:hypothetical protein